MSSTNDTGQDSEIVDRAVEWLRAAVPANWSVDIASVSYAGGNLQQPRRLDSAIELTTGQGIRAVLIVQARRRFTPRDAEIFSTSLTMQLRTVNSNPPILVISEWLSSRTRERLQAQGVNYLDLTGNALLRLESPALFIGTTGSGKAPKPVERGAVRLRGAKAARVVRLMADVRPPFGVQEIAAATGVTASYVSRLIDFFDGEALIERTKRGKVQSVDVDGLLRRWASQYDVFRSNDARTYIAPRGATALLEQLRQSNAIQDAVVVTGSFAAVRWAPVASPALLAMYSGNPEGLAEKFALLPSDEGSNVALLRPYDKVVWERTTTDGAIRYAAASQVAVDCLSGNGRMPAEGDALLAWMSSNKSTWQLPSVTTGEGDAAP